MRSVPDHIPRPDYADTGMPGQGPRDLVQTDDVIARMRRAGAAAVGVLRAGAAAIAEGITTDEIDRIVHEATIAAGAYPSTLNYRGYRKSCCTSVNEVICHGIPDDRKLANGDIVNLDVTVYLDGVHGDVNATYAVGVIDESSQRLIEVTRECLDVGIAAVRPGRRINEVGRAILEHATRLGYGVVRAFSGHGIGETFHNGVTVPHYYEPRIRSVMQPGMTFTIEPMITIGDWHHALWDDGWTAVTVDLSRTAQFEHTVLVTDDGVEILTDAPEPI